MVFTYIKWYFPKCAQVYFGIDMWFSLTEIYFEPVYRPVNYRTYLGTYAAFDGVSFFFAMTYNIVAMEVFWLHI